MTGEPDPSFRQPLDLTGAQGVQIGPANVQHNYFGPRAPVSWPVVLGSPPAAAHCLQPRSEEMAELDLTGSPTTTVLTGLGGVGKSQLAAEFRRCWLAGPGAAGLAVWVDGTSRAGIVAGLAAAAAVVAEPGTVDVRKDPEGAAAWLRTWCGSTGRPWLVVVDDLTDPASLRGTDPARPSLWLDGSAGHMLITTRRTDTILLARARRVPVGLFTLGQAHDYLRDKLQHQSGALEGVVGLAQDLQRLPLALSQAAAFIADRRGSCADYRARFRDRTRRLDELFPPDSLVDDYQRTVATTWWISIEAADALPPLGVARPLLELAAHYSSQGFPTGVLEGTDAVDYVRARVSPADVVGPQQCWDALTHLARLSLLTLDDTAALGVSVHPLVGRAAREGAVDGVRAATVSADALASYWSAHDHGAETSDALRASAATVIDLADEALWTDDAHLLLFQFGNHLEDTGQLVPSQRHFEDLVARCIQRLGPRHRHTLAARHNLIHARQGREEFAGTVEDAAELVDDYVAALGADDRSTLAARRLHASCLGDRGEHDVALDGLELLRTDQVRLLGRDDPDTLKTRQMLAMTRGACGDPAAAVRELAALADDCAHVFGPDHRSTLDARTSLGIWRGAAGDHQGALATLRGLVEDCVWTLGAEHPATLTVRHHLASEEAFEDPASATEAFRRLHDDRRRLFGPDHPDHLRTAHEMARNRGNTGDPAGAAEDFRRLLAEHTARFGTDHPQTRTVREELAFWLGEASDPAAAARVQRTVADDHARHNGRDALATIEARYVLAGFLVASGDPTGARRVLDEVLADYRRLLPADHVQVLAVRADVAVLHAVTGDPGRALLELQRVHADQVRVLGRAHQLTVTTGAALFAMMMGAASQELMRGLGPASGSGPFSQ